MPLIKRQFKQIFILVFCSILLIACSTTTTTNPSTSNMKLSEKESDVIDTMNSTPKGNESAKESEMSTSTSEASTSSPSEVLEKKASLKVLAIGNSFSQDAFAWLNHLSKSEDILIETHNLYIGGASLELHARNIKQNRADYSLEENGLSGAYVSIEEALTANEYDLVSVQQVSGLSGMMESYEPHLGEILKLIREKQSNAKIYLHQTWAYDNDSTHGDFAHYHNDRKEMFNRIVETTEAIAQKYDLEIIPVGTVIEKLRDSEYFAAEKHAEATYSPYGHQKIKYDDYALDPDNPPSLTRDGFHLNYYYGRYAAALTWYRTLSGQDVSKSSYTPPTPQKYPPNQELSEEAWQFIRDTVEEVCSAIDQG